MLTQPVYPERKFEVYINSDWTEITSDVIGDVFAKWGISDNSPFSRIADTGFMDIVLDNSTRKYSPNSTAPLDGWELGVPFKLSFVFDGNSYVRFFGYVKTIDLGSFGSKFCKLKIVDWFDYSAEHPLGVIHTLLDKTADEVIDAIVSSMPIRPANTSYDVGNINFPAVFASVSSGSKAYSEFNKIALSEFGYVYLKKDKVSGEMLVLENSTHRTGMTAIQQVTKTMGDSGKYKNHSSGFYKNHVGGYFKRTELEDLVIDNTMIDLEYAYGDKILNEVTVRAYPKLIDTTNVVLFSTFEAIYLASGQTKVFNGLYADRINGYEVNALTSSMIQPVATTDYLFNANSDGSGANLTASLAISANYGSASVTYTAKNNSTSGGYILAGLKARGHGIYSPNPIEHVENDSVSYNKYGYKTEEVDQVYNANLDYIKRSVKSIIDEYKTPKTILNKITMLGNSSNFSVSSFLLADVGSLIRVKSDYENIDCLYFIQGVEFTVTAGGAIQYSYIVKEFFSLILGLELVTAKLNVRTFTNNEAIIYDNMEHLDNLTTKTLSAWVWLKGNISGHIMGSRSDGAGYSFMASTGDVTFQQTGKTGFTGVWHVNGLSNHLYTWMNIAVSRDSSTYTNDPKVYINGVLQTINSTSYPTDNAPDETNTRFSISNWTDLALTNAMFRGFVKDARVYNKILTDSEVALICSDGPGGTAVTDGLVFQGPCIKSTNSEWLNKPIDTTKAFTENVYGYLSTPFGTTGLVAPAFEETDTYSPTLDSDIKNISTHTGSAVGSLTWNHTVASGSNRMLLVSVGKQGTTGRGIATVKYGGVDLIKIGSSTQETDSTHSAVEMWYLINPTVGTANIVVTLMSGTNYMEAVSVDMVNVIQDDPIRNINYNYDTGGDSYLNVKNTIGDIVIDAIAYSRNVAATIGNGQYSLCSLTSSSDWRFNSSFKSGTGLNTFSWANTVNGFAHMAISIKKAS